MKAVLTKFSTLAIVAMVSLSSCLEKEIKDLVKLDTPIEFNKNYTVDLDANDPKSFEEKETIDTKIEGVEVTKVEVKKMVAVISNVDTHGEAIGGSITYSIGSSNVIIPFTDIAALEGQELDVKSVANSLIAPIEDYFLNNPDAELETKITFDKVPVRFDINLDMELVVTGKPE